MLVLLPNAVIKQLKIKIQDAKALMKNFKLSKIFKSNLEDLEKNFVK